MPIVACNRCGRCHIGSLVFAPTGFLILFRNEWEQELSEEDFDFWSRTYSPRIRPPENIVRFVEIVNSYN
jgi:hypothetical protein